MSKYTIRRISQVIPLLFAIVVLTFLLIHLAPGDPVDILVSEGANPEMIEIRKHEYGLDRPVAVQLVKYVEAVLKGDFGFSFVYNVPVLELILERIPPTVLLMLTSLLLASVLGIALGVLASLKPFSFLDSLIAFLSLAGYSMPVFWLGQLLVLCLSLWVNLFPIGGMFNVQEDLTGFAYLWDLLRHLALPAITFSMYNFALICRITRTSMLEITGKDFVMTARSKGIKERTVVLKHMLRNALSPVVTLIGMSLGYMFTGSVLTETVFSWPGIGRLTYDSIFNRDYPVLMGIFIFISIAIILANLLTDLVYGLLDPRITYD